MKPEELAARMGEADHDQQIDTVVDGIRRVADKDKRLALVRAVHEGMNAVERNVRSEMFGGKPGGRETWGTGRVSPWGDRDSGPLVCASLGAPPARFDRYGRPQLDYAAMRFIVTARENFDFLLDLAEEGLAARKARADENA